MGRKNLMFLFLGMATISYGLSACASPFPILEDPNQTFQAKMDLSNIEPYTGYERYGITPLQGGTFLYFVNGWDKEIFAGEETNTNVESGMGFDDSKFRVGKIYRVTLPNITEDLNTIEEDQIFRIIPYNDAYLAFVNPRKDYSIDIEGGLNLIFMDRKWNEKWRYSINDDYYCDAVVSQEKIILEILDKSVYEASQSATELPQRKANETEKQEIFTWVVLNQDGEIEARRRCKKDEKLINIEYSMHFNSFYAIVRSSTVPDNKLILKKLDQSLSDDWDITLPFGSNDEEIVHTFIADDEKITIITNKSVYQVIDKKVSKTLDIYEKYREYIKNDYELSPNIFISTRNGQVRFVSVLENDSRPNAIMDISFYENFSACTVRFFPSFGDPSCAFEDDEGNLVIIDEGDEGELTICKWNI